MFSSRGLRYSGIARISITWYSGPRDTLIHYSIYGNAAAESWDGTFLGVVPLYLPPLLIASQYSYQQPNHPVTATPRLQGFGCSSMAPARCQCIRVLLALVLQSGVS